MIFLPGEAVKTAPIAVSHGAIMSQTKAHKPNPTEFAEAFLDGIRKNGTSGTFLTTYRNGRPVNIREVNNLQ